jgi:hypothetical protein
MTANSTLILQGDIFVHRLCLDGSLRVRAAPNSRIRIKVGSVKQARATVAAAKAAAAASSAAAPSATPLSGSISKVVSSALSDSPWIINAGHELVPLSAVSSSLIFPSEMTMRGYNIICHDMRDVSSGYAASLQGPHKQDGTQSSENTNATASGSAAEKISSGLLQEYVYTGLKLIPASMFEEDDDNIDADDVKVLTEATTPGRCGKSSLFSFCT